MHVGGPCARVGTGYMKEAPGMLPPLVSCLFKCAAHLRAVPPFPTRRSSDLELMKIAHVTSGVVRLLFVIVTAQPPLPAARPTVPRLFPVVTQKLTAPAVGGVVHAVVAV